MGLSQGLSYGLSAGLFTGPSLGLSQGLIVGLSQGLGQGLSIGLKCCVIVVLVYLILASSVEPLRFAERIHWTLSGLLQPQHLRTSLSIAGALFLFNGLSVGLIVFLPDSWLSISLSAGLSFGLSCALSYWVVLGLYQGIKQEQLKDQDRQLFNQGIRRSLRNGLLLSLISAIIINAINVLSYCLGFGLSIGLSFGLSQWLNYELNIAWILLPASLVVIWALSGGLTVLRHYVIRWLLARSHAFPWRAREFLDDATTRILLLRIGGGYSFIHRRLQDYFADTTVSFHKNE